MARETFKHNGETRDQLKVVGTFNCNYDPYEMITYQNYRIEAMEKHIETLEFINAMMGADLEEENATASIFLTAFKEGL